MKKLTLAEIEYGAHYLAKKLMTRNEPIPDFNTRVPFILESCLTMPFQSFGGKHLYKTLEKKAAILFYLMIKNHPFQNGNKRVAVTTLFYFLYKNGRWLHVDNKELYNFSVWIAESNARVKDATVQAIEKFIKSFLINL